MPYSYIDYGLEGDLTGAQQGGAFTPTTLEYVSSADIYVTRTDSAGTVTALTSSQFTVTTSPSLSVQIKTLAQGGIDIAASDLIRIGRTTPIDALSRTFTDGSVLKASDLNTQNTQLLYVVQENKDDVGGTLPIGTDNKYNAGGRVIKNLGLGTDDDDAVTMGYVNLLSLYGSAQGGVTPQFWQWTTAAGDDDGTHRTLTLDIPVPTTAVNNMYIVEVEGVMQRPSTNGTDGDYDVTELGGTYTIKMINGSASGSQAIANGTSIVIRNFGTTRNTLVAPYKAGTTTDVSLEIEKIAGQTGDLIKADDSSGTDLFRVEADGSVLLGDGLASSTATTKLSTTALEIANQDLSGGDKHNQYGAVMQVLDSNRAHLSLQGSQAALAGNYAFRVDHGQSDGSLVNTLYATYGGALVATGAITGDTVTATNGFSTTAASTLGNVTLADGSTFAIGSGKVAITNDQLQNTRKIILGPTASNASNDGISFSDGTVCPGGLFLNSNAVYMGRGGNGDGGVAYGGQGSLTFTSGGTSKYGPVIGAQNGSIFVGGFKVPENQGGNAGQDGTTPAPLYYASGSAFGNYAGTVSYADAGINDILGKQQIAQGIATATDTVTAANKYEKLGTLTFDGSAAVDFLDHGGVNWADRYSAIEIHFVAFISQNQVSFGFGLSRLVSGSQNHLGSSWNRVWGDMPTGQGIGNVNFAGSASPTCGSVVWHDWYNNNTDHEWRGKITINFWNHGGSTQQRVDVVADYYTEYVNNRRNRDIYSIGSQDFANKPINRIYLGRFASGSGGTGQQAAINDGQAEIFGIKR